MIWAYRWRTLSQTAAKIEIFKFKFLTKLGMKSISRLQYLNPKFKVNENFPQYFVWLTICRWSKNLEQELHETKDKFLFKKYSRQKCIRWVIYLGNFSISTFLIWANKNAKIDVFFAGKCWKCIDNVKIALRGLPLSIKGEIHFPGHF